MKEKTRQALLAMNRRFYDDGAGRFSATRQRPWPGWSELLPELREAVPGRACLDAGCGNGRFAAFLAAENLLPAHYLGLDGSEPLLAEARATLPDPPFELRHLGLEEMSGPLPPAPTAQNQTGGQGGNPPLKGSRPFSSSERGAEGRDPGSFDLIVLFGVLHHVPGRAARQAFLEALAGRLAEGGLLVVSFWLLDRFPARFTKLDLGDGGLELEPGDALLSFDGRPDRPRYCHFPDDAEIDALCGLAGCEELRRFRADGPSGADNLYAVLRRVMLRRP